MFLCQRLENKRSNYAFGSICVYVGIWVIETCLGFGFWDLEPRRHLLRNYPPVMAAHTGIEPTFGTSRFCVNRAEVCRNQRVNRKSRNGQNCRIAQYYAVLPAFAKATARQAMSEFVRKSSVQLMRRCTPIHVYQSDAPVSLLTPESRALYAPGDSRNPTY